MALRRLSILCSHLHPINSDCPSPNNERSRSNGLSCVSLSNCDSGSENCQMDESEKGNEGNGCVFCMIIRGESPAFKLYEDDICLCILDSNPLTHGHSLIIPKSHFSSLVATPPSVVAAMCSTVPFLSNAIMKATHCDSFNLLVNNGADAGQVIFHTHLHIIPRKAQDRLWTSKGFRRKPLKLNQDTIQLADCIREGLSLQVNHCDGFEGQRSKLPENS
ncbi:adenylylsulfatase HINT3 isoform X1 [Magnolia sinica]|uniref:adenylylsulfatase HINT3 isoform X1 n=1 Tax=Magnolia sinica TaxID=86752 RepID=UPI002659F87B|nr:adenylylsulfatase HINT3 isoform X1 [Magnolia sinica]